MGNDSKAELSRDPIVRRAVSEQTAQWSQLAERQRREERALVRSHLEERRKQLRKLCINAQSAQTKQLAARHNCEIKEIGARQAKISVETSREVMNDKSLKSRGIKDRRLREKQQNNTKKFMEERRVAQNIQEREKEKLKKIHNDQLEELEKDMNRVSPRISILFILLFNQLFFSPLNFQFSFFHSSRLLETSSRSLAP